MPAIPPQIAAALAAAARQHQSPRRFVSFISDINTSSVEALLAVCAQLANDGAQEVCLMLSTPGGQVSAGITAYNVLRAMPFKLITHNTGAVNSIGNVIFLAGAERYACPNSTFMFHGVGLDVRAQQRLEQKTLRELIDGVRADESKIAAIMEERTRIPRQEIDQLFLEASTRDPGYARTHGIIDEVRNVDIPAGTPIQQLVFKR